VCPEQVIPQVSAATDTLDYWPLDGLRVLDPWFSQRGPPSPSKQEEGGAVGMDGRGCKGVGLEEGPSPGIRGWLFQVAPKVVDGRQESSGPLASYRVSSVKRPALLAGAQACRAIQPGHLF
jgi:hypothetical protein